MEEVLELKRLIETGDREGAMLLIAEMEEMSKSDKMNKIYSYSIVLLLHLIKQVAENRSTKSWDVSIDLALDQIRRTNKCHKSGGIYVPMEELKDLLNEAYIMALKQASLEAFGGIYSPEALGQMVNAEEVLALAWHRIGES